MKKTILLTIAILISFNMYSKNNIGLVLSGGGALGYAHIGALQAFEENGFEFNYIAGTSMGALVGVLYAEGIKPAEIMQIIKDERMYKISNLMSIVGKSSKTGFAAHKGVRKLFEEVLPHNSFDSLKIPYYTCVTNLDNGTYEFIGKGGNLHDYVIASASIPGVFEIMRINGVQYVDGGVLNNMPTQAIEPYCDKIIGVNVLPYYPIVKLSDIQDVALRSIRAMQKQNSAAGMHLCDFVIEPKSIVKFHEFNFDKYLEIYQYGYNATVEFIKNNPDILKFKKTK